MAYFRQLDTQLATLQKLFDRDQKWLIMVNADPDALGSAMALKRIMSYRVADVGISHVNEVTRPDNLSMIRYLNIPTRRFTPAIAEQYDKFALVDSQPHHHKNFEGLHFSIVLDHHPQVEGKPVQADYKEIKPEYGSNCTLLTEYLHNLNIRPGKLLATALMYGIKSDTSSFERSFCDVDVKAFRYLSKHADHNLIRKIVRSEFRLEWLEYFSLAFSKLNIKKNGAHVYLGEVDNPDILVILADFFLRIHEIVWSTVAGVFGDTLIVIFRSDGVSRDVRELGKKAAAIFGDVGSAGGHAAMARAEVKLGDIPGQDPERFILSRLGLL
ncbi:phosphoesterase [Oceanidesulfovibrio indonesiensis]|uniref:Phosphoesterase n=1 Tax=Oceanidesulfovibrio indonesiensis TaxID=54767 RepID=A0A7M3MFY4_9BACT|nr:DHH family phosphoesterase [Oceanidesulfovibrio indonesiensis]TVM17658.1 phosphoesterase [Oceanidesulfovibrio indonesiensis]